ncbi:MAG TPA: hypothetical protein VK936_04155 [Longimicrobiales bacterium]|nr:hypothetical protein [Longimicrobiales bacterium]
MTEERSGDPETVNRGLQEKDDRLADPDRRPPHSEPEGGAPGGDREGATKETPADDISRLENPPQTEGPRERSNDAV